jgi:phage/conjugal plasmid C-4 type zinc finger TraR family protein
MADIADRAQNEMYWTRKAMEQNRVQLNPIGASAHWCIECGDPIPEARRQAVPGVQLCVECQQEADG